MANDYELLIRFSELAAQGAHVRYAESTDLGLVVGPAVLLDFSDAEFRRLVLLACERCDDTQIKSLSDNLLEMLGSRKDGAE